MSHIRKEFIMRKFICLFILSISLTGFCQEMTKEDYSPSKWRFGGGLGLGFGSNGYFGFAISPFVGYEIIPQLEGGLTVGYQYSKWSDSKQNLFNAGPYLNYYPIPSLFARAHYEYYTGTNEIEYEFESDNFKYNFNESALWLGGGYRTTGKVQFYAGLMYNVLYQNDSSLFSSGFRPIVGVSVGL